MDAVIITCPRCGCEEGYAHPDSVRERKECLGCVADELMRGGLTYKGATLTQQVKDAEFDAAGVEP